MSRSISRGRDQQKRKLFITNLDGQTSTHVLEDELRNLFEKHGKVEKVAVKVNKAGTYSFAFVDFQDSRDAKTAIEKSDGYQLYGKNMRVQFQDDSKRKRERANISSTSACFKCGKDGHFARNCSSLNEGKELGIQNQKEKNHWIEAKQKIEMKIKNMKDQKIDIGTKIGQEKNKEVEGVQKVLQIRGKNPNTKIEISPDQNLMTRMNTEEKTRVSAEAPINAMRRNINPRQAKAINIKVSTEKAEETVIHQVRDPDRDHQVERIMMFQV